METYQTFRFTIDTFCKALIVYTVYTVCRYGRNNVLTKTEGRIFVIRNYAVPVHTTADGIKC
jgi:hypothetical protein